MVDRFRERAQAVRERSLPPVEGPERQRFREQAQLDYMDFAMVGDADATLEDGILTLRVDLRPSAAAAEPAPTPGLSRRSSSGCPPCGAPRAGSPRGPPTATTWPTKSPWLPRSRRCGPRSRATRRAGASTGAPRGGLEDRLAGHRRDPAVVAVHAVGRPASRSVGPAARSSRSSRQTVNRRRRPPAAWVTAAASTATATSFGSVATWTTRLAVMRLRCRPPRSTSARLPIR